MVSHYEWAAKSNSDCGFSHANRTIKRVKSQILVPADSFSWFQPKRALNWVFLNLASYLESCESVRWQQDRNSLDQKYCLDAVTCQTEHKRQHPLSDPALGWRCWRRIRLLNEINGTYRFLDAFERPDIAGNHEYHPTAFHLFSPRSF